MKIKILVLLVACCTLFAGVKNDAEAPTFVLMNQDSEMVDLASFKGKKVILEWTNHGCPFVAKHYKTKNMQSTQQLAENEDIVWLSIISSAPGTPPGSLVKITSLPIFLNSFSKMYPWVVFPEPSIPSKVINLPDKSLIQILIK